MHIIYSNSKIYSGAVTGRKIIAERLICEEYSDFLSSFNYYETNNIKTLKH